MRWLPRSAVLVGAALLLVPGCRSSQEAPRPAPSSSAVGTPSPAWPAPDGSSGADAVPSLWALHPTVVFSTRTRRGSTGYGVLALGPGREVLVAVTPRVASRRIHQASLRLVADGNSQEIRAPKTSSEPRQTLSGAVSDRYVVWQESSSDTLAVNPWVLYGFDRRTRQTRVLTRAPRVDGMAPPPVPAYTGPVLAGDMVFWAQVTAVRPRPEVGVFACRVDDCAPRLVAPATALPASDGRRVYGVRARSFGPEAGRTTEVVSLTAGSRAPRVVAAPELDPRERLNGFTASRRLLAWTTSDGKAGSLVVTDIQGRLIREIDTKPGQAYGFPAAGDDDVAYSNVGSDGPASYAYSVSRDRVFGLGEELGYYFVAASGPRLAWQQQVRGGGEDGPVEWVVVDLAGVGARSGDP